MKNKLFSIGGLFFALILTMATAPPINAQGSPGSTKSEGSTVTSLPAAYYKTSWANVSDRINGAGTVEFNGIDAREFSIPNTGTVHRTNGAEQSLVYDNGPHFNVAGSPDLSVLESATLGMSTYGANIAHPDYAAADDFVLDEETEITSIDFYSYQTGATAPSVNAIYVQIWDGDPSGDGSVIWGDKTTNVFSSVSESGAYRVLETTQGARDRMIQKVTVEISDLTLDPGTYYVEYSLGGSVASGPWQAPIAILGEATTGDALQLTTTGWQPMMDSGTDTPQGVPFQIYGNTSGGAFPDPYCEVSGNATVEAISRVVFADIDNSSDPNGTIAHEDFTGVVGNINAGETYSFAAEGNTAGSFTNYITVWIDWDQDGVFDEATERYDIGTITGSTGTDGQQAVNDIDVPSDALEGATRMRVMKRYSGYPTDSCTSGSSWGQTEDYTVEVSGGGGGNEYCIPEGTNASRYVDNFATTGGIENITNNGSGFSSGGYGDFYDTHSVEQAPGEDVEFTVDIEGGTAGFRIWVDWNQDGVFDTTEEVAFASDGYKVSHEGTITVPANALSGETRMRIVSHWLSTSGDVDPCETGFTYGEFEDYKFIVSEGTAGDEGQSCDDPLVVTSLPYDHAGNTADYGNNYTENDVPPLAPGAVTTGTGSNFYLSGPEVVYSYTPDENEVINVSTTNDDDWVGLWAFTGCPFDSTVGYHTSISGDTRLIEELPVEAGETYYFVLSTWESQLANTDYTIHIEKVGGGGDPGGDACAQGTVTNDVEDGWGNSHLLVYANDFVVEEGVEFTLEEMKINFILEPGLDVISADITFYEDTGGNGPGSEITGATETGIVPDSQTLVEDLGTFQVKEIALSLTNPPSFEGNSGDTVYWMGIILEYNGASSYMETTSIYDTPNEAYFLDDGVWVSGADAFGDPMHGVIEFSGTCDGVGGGDPGGECEQGYASADPLGTPTGVGFTGGNIVANDIVVQAEDSFTLQTITFDVIALDGTPTEFDLEIYEDNGTGGVGASTGITQHFDSSNMSYNLLGNWGLFYPLYEVTLDVSDIELTAGSEEARYWLAIASEVSSTGDFTYWSSDDYVSNPDSYPTWQYLESTQQWEEYVGPSEGVMWVEGICGSGGGEPGGECDITTTFEAGNNGSAGGIIFFDLTVDDDEIDLTALDLNVNNSGVAFTVDVYTIDGTYAGNETNETAWTLVTSGSGTSAGEENPSHAELDDPITFDANSSYGIALIISSQHSHYYTNGNGSNQHYSNDHLSLDLGAAANTPWASPFADRVFNGTLYYEVEGGCSGGGDPSPCDEKVVMECGVTYTADLVPNSGEWENYTGVTWSYTGSEQVFEFTAPETGTYEFELDEGSNDADFMVMDACSNTAGNVLGDGYWTGAVNETLELNEGDTIYIIADLFSSSPTTVSIQVNCPSTPPPPGDCPIEYSGDFEDGLGNMAAGIILASDFPVPADESWILGSGKFEILYDVTSVDISIYEDAGGQPGTQIVSPTTIIPESQTVIGQTTNGTDIYEVELDLTNLEVTLEGGASGAMYWVAIETVSPSGSSFWHYAETANNGTYMFYSTDYASWTDASTAGFPVDGAFTICITEGVGIDDQNQVAFTYYPNPTTGMVNIEANRDISSVSVMNVLGQEVLATEKLESGQVDLSSLATGTYMFRVTFEDGTIETFKVIRE